jgi:hypothetical protein
MYNYKIFILESDSLLIPSLIGFFGLHALLFIICKIIKKGTNFTNFTWDPFKGLLKHFFFCVQIAHVNSMLYKLVNLWAINCKAIGAIYRAMGLRFKFYWL